MHVSESEDTDIPTEHQPVQESQDLEGVTGIIIIIMESEIAYVYVLVLYVPVPHIVLYVLSSSH